jgi:hypothetical protein
MANYKKSNGAIDLLSVLVGIFLVLLIFFLFLCIGTAVVFFGWNLGVVALVAASGGTVGKISFWTAFFINLALGILRGLFKSS